MGKLLVNLLITPDYISRGQRDEVVHCSRLLECSVTAWDLRLGCDAVLGESVLIGEVGGRLGQQFFSCSRDGCGTPSPKKFPLAPFF